MPSADGSDTLTDGSGDTLTGGSGDDILSTLDPDVFSLVWIDTITQPVDPATARAEMDAHPGPVANVVVTYDAAGNEIISSTQTQGASAPFQFVDPSQILPPTASNAFIVVTPGHTNISGGQGDDTLQGNTVDDVMRGGDGNDSVQGGSAFDDINGNKGADTIDGGAGGSDWLVGGQGDDSIAAHAGDNLILGERGGSEHAYISGDMGNDTETGGAGPDLFHGSQNIGTDVITNFDYAKGDRVELDPGTSYSVKVRWAPTPWSPWAGATRWCWRT